jgi:hypothetical protein
MLVSVDRVSSVLLVEPLLPLEEVARHLSGDDCFFCTHYYNLLSVEELLSYNGGQTTQEMSLCVHDDYLKKEEYEIQRYKVRHVHLACPGAARDHFAIVIVKPTERNTAHNEHYRVSIRTFSNMIALLTRKLSQQCHSAPPNTPQKYKARLHHKG